MPFILSRIKLENADLVTTRDASSNEMSVSHCYVKSKNYGGQGKSYHRQA
jgi:hypothetical protein